MSGVGNDAEYLPGAVWAISRVRLPFWSSMTVITVSASLRNRPEGSIASSVTEAERSFLIQLVAGEDAVPVGQAGIFVRLRDGCPTLEQLGKLLNDTASHDSSSYYYDFRYGGCVEVIPGDKGINLEFNFTLRANRIRLDSDHQSYWFNTVGTDGSLWFTKP